LRLVVVGQLPEHLRRNRPWLEPVQGLEDSELAWLYRNAAAVIVPSRHEGFGLPVVEALSLGAPVVASDIPALREVGGRAARFAPPDAPDVFAAQLRIILDHPLAEREHIAASQAAAPTPAQTVASIVEVYRGVLADEERRRAWAPTAVS
jgi:glycosyltransferase involved in cell wall biosynthesis